MSPRPLAELLAALAQEGLLLTAPAASVLIRGVTADSRSVSRGDVYVSEVIWSAGANRGHISPECHTLQKFVRTNQNEQ